MTAARIGAVIHMGAGTRLLTMGGNTWNLFDMARNQLSAVGSLLSEAMGLPPSKARQPRPSPRNNRK